MKIRRNWKLLIEQARWLNILIVNFPIDNVKTFFKLFCTPVRISHFGNVKNVH